MTGVETEGEPCKGCLLPTPLLFLKDWTSEKTTARQMICQAVVEEGPVRRRSQRDTVADWEAPRVPICCCVGLSPAVCSTSSHFKLSMGFSLHPSKHPSTHPLSSFKPSLTITFIYMVSHLMHKQHLLVSSPRRPTRTAVAKGQWGHECHSWLSPLAPPPIPILSQQLCLWKPS